MGLVVGLRAARLSPQITSFGLAEPQSMLVRRPSNRLQQCTSDIRQRNAVAFLCVWKRVCTGCMGGIMIDTNKTN